MTDTKKSPVLQFVRRLAARQHDDDAPDEQLLERFARQRDESAFDALLRRHGPMVLSVCRGILRHTHDVEDAFQATFLIFTQKAASIRQGHSLGGWLYEVAYRVALKASAKTARAAVGQAFQPDERMMPDTSATDPLDDLTVRELRQVMHEELRRLPDKFRMPLILCYLQGKSQEEAARQLGWPQRRVKDRLQRGKERLHRRLSQRGLAPVAALGTVVFAEGSVPAALVGATVQSALHAAPLTPALAGLVEAGGAMLSFGKAKMATLILLASSLLSGAGVWLCRVSLAPAVAPPAERREQPRPSAHAEKPATAVVVRGRVLDPDGKPVEGARLYWPRLRTPQPRSEEDIEYPERDKTDAEGRFRFELPRGDTRNERMSLIAAADGYGADWTALPAGASPAELTLRLVEDLLIDGRILSTEGKPLAGIRVGIVSLATTPQGKLDPFLTAWKNQWRLASQQTPKRLFVPSNKVLSSATTDKDGRFRLGGGGVGRVAILEVRGTAISQGSLWVVGQDGFDPAEINKSVLSRTPLEERQLQPPPQLYGPKFTYVAQPSRRIEGRVHEAGSGKPVAGYMILCGAGYNNSRSAVSDKDGRYQLDGLPKLKQYLLSAEPPANSAWLPAGARVEDKGGLQPINADFTVARGVLVRGRILDRVSGKGVAGGIRFVPLPGNTFAGKPGYDSYKYERLMHDVGGEGRFQLAVMPGPGVLMVQAYGNEKADGGQEIKPYKQAEFDAKDRERVKITENDDGALFAAIDNSLEFLSIQSAVKVVDFAPDAETATCDLFLERGLTATVKIEDADGKPLTGTTVAGVTASWPNTFSIQDATCTIFALDPKKPRRVLFFHAERKLAGSLMLRGDEKEPVVVRLGQTGSVMGHMLDRDGQPLVGADLQLSAPDRSASELYRQLAQLRPRVRTDKDGRFRVEGIVPDVKFTLGITQGRTFFVGEPRIGSRQVKSGETLDLGEIRVKPGP
jgi:RNA polymerase sigma factor (sigma-70 family)